MKSLASMRDAVAFSDAGIHFAPYGLPPLPKAPETHMLKRQIRRGITMPTESKIFYDEEMINATAELFLVPDAMIPQFESPRYKVTRAGYVATVSGLVASPFVQVNPFNPRPNMKLAIPPADASGRVAAPWAAIDRAPDPKSQARMLVKITNRAELNGRVLESERHILGEQATLANLVTHEGMQEDILAVMTRFETAGVKRHIAATALDGNSRAAIARTTTRQWIARSREEILDTVTSLKPRRALAHLLDRMRDGIFPLDYDDPIAFRHFYKALNGIAERYDAKEIIENNLFGVINLFVIPVTLIVGFAPFGSETILDAVDLMVRNLHHPDRSPTKWDPSAGNTELRDEIVRKLVEDGSLTEGQALLLGPKFEEAARRFKMPAEPDTRAYALVDLVNGNHDLGKRARSIILDATGIDPKNRQNRAQLIVAGLTEQLRTADPKLRELFATTMHDVLSQKRYGSVATTPEDSGRTPRELLKAAKADHAAGIEPDASPALLELGIKGAIALAALGHLTRTYGTLATEIPRPYQLVDNMLGDEFGLKILADAIEAWRGGERLSDYDAEKQKPIRGSGALKPAKLVEFFPSSGSVPPQPSARDILEAMRKLLAQKFQPFLDEMLALDEVRREGAPPDVVREVLNILEPATAKLNLQAAKYEEHYGRAGL